MVYLNLRSGKQAKSRHDKGADSYSLTELAEGLGPYLTSGPYGAATACT